MKILKTKKIFMLFVITMILLPTMLVLAEDYTLLAPLPGLETVPENNALGVYIPFVFKLLIGLSAAAAVLMIVYGGIQYMTTDAIMKKEEGKKQIQNAVFGLVLVISAWLILNTINPGLLKFDLNIESITTKSGPEGHWPSSPNWFSNGKITTSCPGCATSGGLTYNISPANLAKFDCQNCKPFGSDIPFGGNTNTNVDVEMSTKLSALNNGLKQQDVSWQVTEAFPPVVNHASGCHYTGNCVDAKPINPTGANLKRFIQTSQNNGLGAQYEVKTVKEQETVIANLKAAGMTGDLTNKVIVVPTINGAHFSVYNCTSNPTKCN
jgi:hypothetical protein